MKIPKTFKVGYWLEVIGSVCTLVLFSTLCGWLLTRCEFIYGLIGWLLIAAVLTKLGRYMQIKSACNNLSETPEKTTE